MASESVKQELATERDLVTNLLRGGLALSTLLMLAGVIVSLASGHVRPIAVSMDDLFRGGLSLGERLMGTGILVLAATPAFRVIALLFLWIRERDWRFVIVAAIVIITLSLSIILGRG